MFAFSSHKSITLLVVTAADVIRADFTGGNNPKLKRFARAERPEKTYVTTATELAIGLLDEKPSQRTIVLSDEYWTGILDVDDRSIYGLEGDDLKQMLKFETESLSNLDPMNSHLGFVELAPVPPDTRRFWCTGVAGDVLHSTAATISVRGGKLAQLCHPMGLSGPSTSNAPWIELHPSIAGAFASTAQGMPRASITPRSRQSDRWFRSLQTNFGSELPAEGWIGCDAESPEAYHGELRRLDGDSTLQEWVGGVANRWVGPDLIPRVVPPVPETSQQTFARAGIAAAFLAATFCGLDFVRDSWTQSSIQREIADLKKPAEEKKKLEGELKQINDQLGKLKIELKELDGKQSKLNMLTARSDRFSELLRLIAVGRDDNLVVDQIAVKPTGLQLIGRAIRSDSANQLAMQLSPSALEMGWNVAAPQLDGDNKMVNGGPWKFSIDLIDTVPKPASADHPPSITATRPRAESQTNNAGRELPVTLTHASSTSRARSAD